MSRRFSLAVSLLLLVGSSRSWSQEVEITPFFGYRASSGFDARGADFDRFSVDSGIAYGASFGISPNESYQFEFVWSRHQSELGARSSLFGSPSVPLTDADVDLYHFNVLYVWGAAHDKVRPYLLGGIGATNIRPQGDLGSETRVSFGVGGGVKFYANEHFGLRLQGRFTPTYINSDDAAFCDIFGFCYRVFDPNYLYQGEFSAGPIFRF